MNTRALIMSVAWFVAILYAACGHPHYLALWMMFASGCSLMLASEMFG